jgi:hypothetical protein
MARSPAEIQADIEMTRHAIEAHLEALRARIPNRWWVPYVLTGGALAIGLILSRLPVLRLLRTGARTVQTGVAVASTAAAVQKFVADRSQGKLPR